nr:hypothetical protein CFP56_52769 [Quercus suber]
MLRLSQVSLLSIPPDSHAAFPEIRRIVPRASGFSYSYSLSLSLHSLPYIRTYRTLPRWLAGSRADDLLLHRDEPTRRPGNLPSVLPSCPLASCFIVPIRDESATRHATKLCVL